MGCFVSKTLSVNRLSITRVTRLHPGTDSLLLTVSDVSKVLYLDGEKYQIFSIILTRVNMNLCPRHRTPIGVEGRSPSLSVIDYMCSYEMKGFPSISGSPYSIFDY